jgi:hypothetical protein
MTDEELWSRLERLEERQVAIEKYVDDIQKDTVDAVAETFEQRDRGRLESWNKYKRLVENYTR